MLKTNEVTDENTKHTADTRHLRMMVFLGPSPSSRRGPASGLTTFMGGLNADSDIYCGPCQC